LLTIAEATGASARESDLESALHVLAMPDPRSTSVLRHADRRERMCTELVQPELGRRCECGLGETSPFDVLAMRSLGYVR